MKPASNDAIPPPDSVAAVRDDAARHMMRQVVDRIERAERGYRRLCRWMSAGSVVSAAGTIVMGWLFDRDMWWLIASTAVLVLLSNMAGWMANGWRDMGDEAKRHLTQMEIDEVHRRLG